MTETVPHNATVTTIYGIDIGEIARMLDEYRTRGVDPNELAKVRAELAEAKLKLEEIHQAIQLRGMLLVENGKEWRPKKPEPPPMATIRNGPGPGNIMAQYCYCECHSKWDNSFCTVCEANHLDAPAYVGCSCHGMPLSQYCYICDFRQRTQYNSNRIFGGQTNVG